MRIPADTFQWKVSATIRSSPCSLRLCGEQTAVAARRFLAREAPACTSRANRYNAVVNLSRPQCHDGSCAGGDPDDDWVLATAVAGEADVIVTGDKDLLVLKRYQGIPIVTPRGFLELLQQNR
jgi:predicted nucleic acid-binding protein